MLVFRVCKRQFQKLDGEGARLHGGRWNRKGVAVVYTANSLALAMLETVVHLSDMPKDYVWMRIRIPDDAGIWEGVASIADVSVTTRLCDNLSRHEVIRVPSIVSPSPDDFNVLLDPGFAGRHAAVDHVDSLVLDERLLDLRRHV